MVEEGETITMYATKRRRRSVKSVKTPTKDPPKSNPSKRHRERLNAELDHLASLLPFEQSVISKLDRLSILRLGVSYLRTKSYFQAALNERYSLQGHHHLPHSHLYSEPGFTDTDSVLQALNGFLFVVTCDGEVFWASRTVEQYLGFHQSDIIHQSALELIHSEDRDDFKNQLDWRSQLGTDQQEMTLQEALLPENNHVLQRSFTVRFRCLLDNTSGFITLEISGRIKLLHGQSLKGEEPPLALMALCCPFGPLPLLDVPPRDYTFKTKHKMDLAPLSMDHRGKLLFGYSDHELQDRGGYDLIHPDDLQYYSAAHQELIKTGSSGLIAYRLMTKDFRWLWLQTSSKVVYKNSKPDFVICTHRHLTDDEGRDLVGKRGSEFKLPYPIIDTDTSGLSSPLMEDEVGKKSPRNKKSKGQLRDYLHTGRKRKTPYRDAFNGINGYTPYTPLNGYPACSPGEVKTDIMYPYAGQNFGLDSATDLYARTAAAGYSAFPPGTGLYPTTADSFRLEADKHAYSNGYYLEPRQYQHTLQYHGNGYSDYMSSAGTKYPYDTLKYGYEHMSSAYGLDLSKRTPYEEEMAKYEDIRKYGTHDYTSASSSAAAVADKYSRMNGSLDSRTSSLYSTTPLLNSDGMSSCSSTLPHSTASPCSGYRTTDVHAGNGSTAGSGSSGGGAAAPADSRSYSTEETKPIIDTHSVGADNSKVAAMSNGHASVIRNASPRTKSPRHERAGGATSGMYGEQGTSVLTSCGNATWPTNTVLKTSPHGTPDHNSDMTSRIISPSSAPKPEAGVALSSGPPQSNSSPATATTATSVIQLSGRSRSCEKQTGVPDPTTAPSTGGIAVPVVKSSSSWLHHLPTPATPYDWHTSAADPYGQRSMRSDMYSTHDTAGHMSRGVIEAPKYTTTRPGDHKDVDVEQQTTSVSNPLLSFSEVSHTLLNTN